MIQADEFLLLVTTHDRQVDDTVWVSLVPVRPSLTQDGKYAPHPRARGDLAVHVLDTTARTIPLGSVIRLVLEDTSACPHYELPYERGIRDVRFIRCRKHYDVPQQNTAEVTGAECGACVAVEREALLAEACAALQRVREELQTIASGTLATIRRRDAE